MESYKEVMVSQPPAMYAQPAKTTNNISLENYKGILLCDRPVSASPKVGEVPPGASAPRDFVAGGRSAEPLGLGVSQERKAHLESNQQKRTDNVNSRKAKSNEVLQRHRRWLRSFARQVRAMKEADVQREVEAAHKAERMRQAAERRAAAAREEEDLPVDTSAVAAATPQPYNMQRALDPWQGTAAKNVRRGNGAGKKPKWAMTADEALDDELGLNDDLLEFARSLDYERFINDYEVAEALQVMRERVREIARENNMTEDDIRAAGESARPHYQADAAGRTQPAPDRAPPASGAAPPVARPAAPGGAAQHDAEWDSGTGRGGDLLRGAISRDALALAERLLASSPSMQKIHTKQSLARVLQRCVLSGDDDVMAAAQRAAPDWGRLGPEELRAATALGPTAVQAPVVSHVSAEASESAAPRGLRDMQRSSERTQGLPYMYRCPAI